MRYWTVSNTPLFLIAAPMLAVLLCSFFWILYHVKPKLAIHQSKKGIGGTKSQPADQQTYVSGDIAFILAIPQVALVLLALTTYHVQIITRLASGYPVWYWWLASLVIEDHKTCILGYRLGTADLVMKWIIMYAVIQGGLFASFLPPA